MRIMMTFTLKADPAVRDLAIARFLQGGAEPPAGLRLLGRWTRADGRGGFDLLEGQDAGTLAEFAVRWADLMDVGIVPVLDDAELTAVFGRVAAARPAAGA